MTRTVWKSLSREWLNVVEYRKYEDKCREYINGYITLDSLNTFAEALVKNGGDVTKMCDIYSRVCREEITKREELLSC